MSILRIALRFLAACAFVAAGVLHLARSDFYERLVPPAFPSPALLVFISGLAQIAGGAGLLISRLRRAAGWGLIALLIAVFPANIYMALTPERFPSISPWALWARLPMQALFVAWIWWVSIQQADTPSRSAAIRE